MKQVYVNGGYTTKFGELWKRDFRDLGVEAAVNAVQNSKINLQDIDVLYVANMAASHYTGQDHLGALFATELGLDCPAFHIEAACASGSAAIRAGFLDLLSGSSENALILGVEKMTDVNTKNATEGLSGASDEEWEAFYGVTFPSLYAMIAREHMNRYGTSHEQLAMCSVKNHKHGTLNPDAHFQKEITVEQVLRSPVVADPLKLFDSSPISDGAAAIVMSSKKKSEIRLIASGHAQDSLALHDRKDITILEATIKAKERAFKQSKLKNKDIDIMEVHDCFSIAEILAYEDLGFVEKGKGGQFVESGDTQMDGSIPTNLSGGLKAAGHPVGATGVKQAVEIVKQLTGKAGKRQVQKDMKYGLTHNIGGSGATCIVNIFEKI
ncbi:thiolase domain-containing protein [Candidatus Dojkabacteria bacterium]|nr:thiolase domain-containing protein [Candidatus Dojkabacteria bacterium]